MRGPQFKCFENLAKGAESVVTQLPNDSLRSFSWDIGTCLPDRIFGHGGVIALKQSQIESLSITTDCVCNRIAHSPKEGLYKLKNLKRLCWRAPDYIYIRDLTDMIYANADSLQHLEVDLVRWEIVGYRMHQSPYEDGPGGLAHSLRFWRTPAGSVAGPSHPALQTLCLTEVGLGKRSAGICDFSVLRVLKLRNCDKWETFLQDAVRLRRPIGLKTFEVLARSNRLNYVSNDWEPPLDISEGDNVFLNGYWNADEVLSEFLVAFNGLEELYVDIEGPLLFHKLFTGVVAHHGTLKRFVNDLTTLGHPADPSDSLNSDSSTDESYTFMFPSPDQVQLEAMGISTDLENLTEIFQSSARSTSLKLLHLRQPKSYSGPESSAFFERVTEQEGRISDTSSSSDDFGEAFRLRPELRGFAEWAFGQDGMPSLDTIACGKYAYGGRPEGSIPADVILCRPKAGSEEGFRILEKHDDNVKGEREEIIDVYRDVLEACPVDSLIEWWITS